MRRLLKPRHARTQESGPDVPRLRHRSTRPALPGGVLRPAGTSPSGPPRQDNAFSVMAAPRPTLLVRASRPLSDIAPDCSAHAVPVLAVVRHPSPQPHCRPVGRVPLPFEPHEVLRPDAFGDRFGATPPACSVDEQFLRRGGRCPFPIGQAFVARLPAPWACPLAMRAVPSGSMTSTAQTPCPVQVRTDPSHQAVVRSRSRVLSASIAVFTALSASSPRPYTAMCPDSVLPCLSGTNSYASAPRWAPCIRGDVLNPWA